MSEFDKLKRELAAEAALTAGKDAAKKLVGDLLSTEEEKKAKALEAEQAEADKKKRRTKYIAFGVIGLLLVVGLIGLVLSYWQYFLLAGVLGLGALYGWYRLKKRFKGGDAELEEGASAKEAVGAKTSKATPKLDKPAVKARIEAPPKPSAEEVEAKRREREAEAEEARAARARDKAAEEEAIDAELRELKARLKK